MMYLIFFLNKINQLQLILTSWQIMQDKIQQRQKYFNTVLQSHCLILRHYLPTYHLPYATKLRSRSLWREDFLTACYLVFVIFLISVQTFTLILNMATYQLKYTNYIVVFVASLFYCVLRH